MKTLVGRTHAHQPHGPKPPGVNPRETAPYLWRGEAGVATPGIPVLAAVDHARRTTIPTHHSANHLLHEALRRELGTHVQQKGSLNAPDRLRFDVSQSRPITADELHQVQAIVNARIRENSEVTTRLMTPDAAVELGAMALFGEKYGDEVRVVAMGEPDANKLAWAIEPCGGTHVRRTGHIGYFRIVGEAAVAARVRRIEAAEDVGGVMLTARNTGEVPARDLKGLADAIGKQQGSGVVALVSTAEGKASIVVAVSPDLTGRISAVDLVRAASTAVGGKGGGERPDLAQAGGPDGARADEALAAVRAAIV